jgi:hypothetical protein
MIKKSCVWFAWIFLATGSVAGCSQSIQQVSNTPTLPPPAVESASPSNLASSKPISGINVAAAKRVIARNGGITYPGWGNANDPADYQTTTNYPKLGRWGNGTNQGTGTFQIVDLGAVYSLNGVGYNIDWDGAFKNSLTFRVEVSTDNKTWGLASEIVHPYSPKISFNKIDIDVAISPMTARYVKYWEPPDGQWNGWGTFHQLRAYSSKH